MVIIKNSLWYYIKRKLAVIITSISSLFIFFLLFSISDPDLFWHLKNGERLIQEGIFPVKDVFSFTGHGKFLVAYEWLSEAIYYILYHYVGYAGLLVLSFLLIFLTLYLFYKLMLNIGLDKNLSILMCVFLLFNFTRYISIRTQLFTFFFFVLFVYLVRSSYFVKGWMKCGALALLVLWGQMHGGFILGIALLFIDAINTCIDQKRLSLKTFLFPLCAVLLSGIHPNGYYSLAYPLWMFLKRPEVCSKVHEWSHIDFSQIYNIPYIILLLVLIYFGFKGIKKNKVWIIFASAFIFFALGNLKLMPYAVILGILMLALSLKRDNIVKARHTFVICAFSCMLFFLIYIHMNSFSSPALFDRPLIERGFPRETAEHIRKNFPGYFIFNPYHWGGYLIYKLYPKNLIFIDGRADLYWKLMADEYSKIISIHPETLSILDGFKVDIAIIPKDFKLASLLWVSSNWELFFEGKLAYLFVRKSILRNPRKKSEY